MASSYGLADKRRDKLHLWLSVLLGVLAFLFVFQPVRFTGGSEFQQAGYTFRFEQPFATSEQVRGDLRKELIAELDRLDLIRPLVAFPTTNDLRIRTDVRDRAEARDFEGRIREAVESVVTTQGKITNTSLDDSAFGAEPVVKLGPIGLYKPALALRLGLDLQGGVQLVLKARTQNTEFRYRLADNVTDLRAALAALPKTAAEPTAPAPAAEADQAAPAEAEKAAAPTEAAPADAAPKAADEALPGEAAPTGGDLRLAQAPADTTGEQPKGVETPTALDEKTREMLLDEDLRREVRDAINGWLETNIENLRAKYSREGDISAEMVGSNIVVIRTFIDPSARLSKADRDQIKGTQLTGFENELKRLFPQTVPLGDARDLSIPRDAMAQVKDVIQRRVDRLGVSEAQVVTQGTDRVAVQLPGIKDPDEAVAIIGTTARLEFRKVPEQYVPRIETGSDGAEVTTFAPASGGSEAVPTEIVYHEAPEFDGSQNILQGTNLVTNMISVGFARENEPAVLLDLDSEGSRRFDDFARNNLNKYLAVYLDGEVISAPVMQSTHYGGRVSISGGFATIEEAKRLETLLKAGSLPVPVDIVEQRMISATLGDDSVNQSAKAGLIGTLIIFVIMVVMFKVSGWLANIALIVYVIFTLALLHLVGATLTLPGILGLLLSVGMAVDANVIVFERLREELRDFPTRPLHLNLKHAYDRSWPAILDGNATALMMAIVLYALGTGAIRGFAVTLSLGIICHLFTALVMTRKMQNLLAASRFGANVETTYRVDRDTPTASN